MNIMSVWLSLCLACWLAPLPLAGLMWCGGGSSIRMTKLLAWSLSLSLGLVVATVILSRLEPGADLVIRWPGWWELAGRPLDAVWHFGTTPLALIAAQSLVGLGVLKLAGREAHLPAFEGGAGGAALLAAQAGVQALALSGTWWQAMAAWWGLTWSLFVILGTSQTDARSLLRTSSARRMVITQFCADGFLWFALLLVHAYFRTFEVSAIPLSQGWLQVREQNPAVFDVIVEGTWLVLFARVGLFPFSGWLLPARERATLANAAALAWIAPFSALAWLPLLESLLEVAPCARDVLGLLAMLCGGINLYVVLLGSEAQTRLASAAGLPLAGFLILRCSGWPAAGIVPEGTEAAAADWSTAFWSRQGAMLVCSVQVVASLLLAAGFFKTAEWGRAAPAPPVEGTLGTLRRLADQQFSVEGLALLLVSLPVRGLAQLVRFGDWFVMRTLFERLPSWMLRAGAEETMLLERAGGRWPVVIAAGLTSAWLLAWLHSWML